MKEEELRDYFAAQAMQSVSMEVQEMKPASFWDWVKQLLQGYLHFSWLHVKYVKSDKDVYDDLSKRAYEYADAMMKERKNKNI